MQGCTVLEVGESPKESIYKIFRSENLDYDEACNRLIQAKKAKMSDVKDVMRQIYNTGIAREQKEESKYDIPEAVTPETLKVFDHFKWVSNPDGTKTKYLKLFEGKRVYLRVDNLIGACQKLHKGQSEPLYKKLEELYHDAFRAGQLSWMPIKDDIPVYNPFYEWLGGGLGKPALRHWENLIECQLNEHPEAIATDLETDCFFYFNEDLLEEGSIANWQSWENKIPNCLKKVFRAFFYSIFDPENRGRQCMWIVDGGHSGKTTIQAAISGFMGNVGVGAIGKGLLSGNFGYSNVYGKRLLFYGDCKHTGLLHEERFINLLGGDQVPIEFKNKTPFLGTIHAKVLINGNHPPQIDVSMKSETSRLIFIPLGEDSDEVKKRYSKVDDDGELIIIDGETIALGNNSFLPDLIKEMPAYLHECKKAYEELCPTRSGIEINKEAHALMVSQCGSEDYAYFESYTQEYVYFGRKKSISQIDLRDDYNNVRGDSKHIHPTRYNDFTKYVNYLRGMHKIVSVMQTIEGKRTIMFMGMSLDNETDATKVG